MSGRPLIGILVSNPNARRKYLRVYRKYAKSNWRLFAFTPSSVLWEKQRVIGLYRNNKQWKERTFRFPDAVYNRCYNRKPRLAPSVEAIIGTRKIFNTVNQLNKWDVYNQLCRTSLRNYLPDTYLYKHVHLPEVLRQHAVLYCKPVYGHKGKHVYRLALTDTGATHVSLYNISPIHICKGDSELTERVDQLVGQGDYLIQRGIPMDSFAGQYFDIRSLVQKNGSGHWTVPTMISRIAYKDYYNTGMYEFSEYSIRILRQIFPADIVQALMEQLRTVSIRIAQVLQGMIASLGELSVDFGVDRNGRLWIIEINGKPQKSLYKDLDRSQKRKIYRSPLDYAAYVARR